MSQLKMLLSDNQLDQLNSSQPETGMSFQILETPRGHLSVLEHGPALPLYKDPVFYDVFDMLAGLPLPTNSETLSQTVNLVYSNRSSALAALQALNISPLFTGSAGALPLIASVTLTSDTTFIRRIGHTMDRRYVGGLLTAGTYLTTTLDNRYANSGLAAVGRYALPMPVPASTVIEYELPKGSAIKVGTVAPAFGQAGGGVEVLLTAAQTARLVTSKAVPNF